MKNNFIEKLKEIDEYKTITISGLNEGEKAFLPSLFCAKTVIITSGLDSIDTYQKMLETFGKKIVVLDEKLPLVIGFKEKNSASFKKYCRALNALASDDFDVLLATPDVLFQKLPSKNFFTKNSLTLEKNQIFNLSELAFHLVKLGYEKQEMVAGEGEFALRGDTLDVFVVGDSNPVRITFFDDEVESLSRFDLLTFKPIEELEKVNLSPATLLDIEEDEKENIISAVNKDIEKLNFTPEVMLRITGVASSQIEYLKTNSSNVSSVFFLPYTKDFGSTIFDYLPNDARIIFDEPKLIVDAVKQINDDNVEEFVTLSTSGELLPTHFKFYTELKDVFTTSTNFKRIAYARMISTNKLFESEHLMNFVCPHVSKYFGRYIDLVGEIKRCLKEKYSILLAIPDALSRKKLGEFLDDEKITYEVVAKPTINDGVSIFSGTIENSAHFEMEKMLIVGTKELCAKIIQTVETSKSNVASYLPNVGDYVVHEVHGIGKCVGIKNIKITNCYRDYIVLEYKDGDMLYLPSENANSISKYTGEEPKLNKIGGAEFYKVKQKVKNSVKQMTFDLIKVYSERLNAKGFVYSPDTYLQQEYENSFPYAYTEDQATALAQIKQDMESKNIMDRLVCGDVGFGKTEVALSSAFKAIQDGKQVAIICPTTILSEQHYSTAVGRMKNFMVNVAVLNRFKTKKEQTQILDNLASGKIDLICGTHRLLSDDVKFKDLGLIIIDEEQRFGVEAKDKLKNLKKSVDVLSLSATPIPRTLYMSLTGIRDVSFISTPPKQRKQTRTMVVDYSDSILVSACKKELDRGGQVLIIYNKVQSINNFYAHVKTLLPNVEIGVAHGQMSPKMLEDAIYNLYSRKTQILISTVLIENGIDLPYANTLFVIDADKLGLSQLYQLRGRIGRSDIEAYAYFSFNKDKSLTQDSYKRLDAIMEFSNFGDGYKLAMRDLEIRGAGDVLGRMQHGHIEQVGYDLYVKLLNEAVQELRGEEVKEEKEIKVDVDISAFVPENFLSSSEKKIALYTKIGKLKTKNELQNFLQETKNSFGSLPEPVKNLAYVGLIKNMGQQVGAKQVVINDFAYKVVFYNDVENTKLYEFLSSPTIDFVLTYDKLPIINLRKQNSTEQKLECMLKFLQTCAENQNK